MQFVPSFVQAQILNYLNDSEYNAILKSVSVDDICRAFANDPAVGSVTTGTVRKALDDMLIYKLIDLGVKIGRTYTYYITPQGSAFCRIMVGETPDNDKKKGK